MKHSCFIHEALVKNTKCTLSQIYANSGMILGLRPANERRRYKITPSLIGGAQT